MLKIQNRPTAVLYKRTKIRNERINNGHHKSNNTCTKKEPICLDVIDADYQDGYIQFTAGNGFYNVITGYSRNLTFHVGYINFLVYSGKLIKGD